MRWAPRHRPGQARSFKSRTPMSFAPPTRSVPGLHRISGHGRCSARHPCRIQPPKGVHGQKGEANAAKSKNGNAGWNPGTAHPERIGAKPERLASGRCGLNSFRRAWGSPPSLTSTSPGTPQGHRLFLHGLRQWMAAAATPTKGTDMNDSIFLALNWAAEIYGRAPLFRHAAAMHYKASASTTKPPSSRGCWNWSRSVRPFRCLRTFARLRPSQNQHRIKPFWPEAAHHHAALYAESCEECQEFRFKRKPNAT